jgi:hypothetical protein
MVGRSGHCVNASSIFTLYFIAIALAAALAPIYLFSYLVFQICRSGLLEALTGLPLDLVRGHHFSDLQRYQVAWVWTFINRRE